MARKKREKLFTGDFKDLLKKRTKLSPEEKHKQLLKDCRAVCKQVDKLLKK